MREVGQYFIVSVLWLLILLNKGLVVMLSWNDFAVPYLGLATIGMAYAIALSLAISILLPTKLPETPKEGEGVSDFTAKALALIVSYWVSYGVLKIAILFI
jgi:hypothetical protein